MVIKFEVDPGKEFQKAITQAASEVEDLTIPFQLITQSWFKSNRAIFALSGPGQYADLTERYKAQKQKRAGFIYPILKRTGALAASITQPGDSDSIAQVVNKKTLILGSKTPYGIFHQRGTSRMPARPWVLIGAEQVAPPDLNRRLDAWVEMIANYVRQKSGATA